MTISIFKGSSRKAILILVLLAGGVAVAGGSFGLARRSKAAAPAATYTVNTTDDMDDASCSVSHCSLREAINLANADPDASAIDFNIPGGDPGCMAGVCTITLTSALAELSTNITINGPTTAVTISGNNSYRVFSVALGAPVAISNLTIANGQATVGGGIYNLGDLTISNCTFTGNKAVGASGEGGAIDTEAGNVRVINSTISGNSSEGVAGGFMNRGTSLTTLTNVTITNNQSNSAQLSNSAPGGGIRQISSTPIILNNTIVAGNRAWFRFDLDSIFTNDDDDLSCEDGAVVDPNSMNNLIGVDTGVVGISSGTNGNQIGTFDAPLNAQLGALENNGGPTFTHLPGGFSPAIDAGNNGLAVDQNSAALTTDQRGPGFVRIQNGTVDIGAVETPPAPPPPPSADVSLTKTSPAQVFPDTDVAFTITITNLGPDAATNLSFTDALPAGFPSGSPMTFVSFTQNSGPVWNCGVPAATTTCMLASLPASTTSVFTFVGHVPAGVALGTEYTNQTTVNSDADPLPDNSTGSSVTSVVSCFSGQVVTTNGDSGAGSLRQAIIDACDGSTITFDMTQVVSPISLTTDGLTIDKNLTIIGPGANTLTVQRSTDGGTLSFTIFRINAGKTANISGLTISNGSSSSVAGGILNADGTLNLDSSTISGNSQSGIANVGTSGTATAIITNSTINGNDASATNGGGISNSAGQNGATAVLTVINSTISGNSATFGGGIANNSSGAGMTATTTIINSTIAGNTNGAGIANGALPGGTATTRLDNTIVAGNLSSGSPVDINGTVDSNSSFNLIGTSGSAGGLTDGTNNNKVGVADARLGPLAFNGGTTQTMALLLGSLALDGGSNTIANDAGLTTDQRGSGFARTVDGPDVDATDTVDIGAFEAQVSVEDITDKATNEDTQLQFIFNVGGAANITSVTATSSNTTLVPNIAANIAVTGSGSTRTLTINPAANLFGASTITVTVNGNNSQSMTDTFVLTVNAVADTPSVTNATTTVNTQTTSGLVISRNPADGAEVTHFKITNITNGTLFKTNGTTQISNDDFITFSEGNAGLKFTPALNSNANGSFQVQASLNNTNGGLGGGVVTATITVNCGPTVVTNSNDSGAGSLRDIILHACPGSTITFDMTPGNVTSPITLTSAELLVDKNLTIQGPGANLLTVMRSTAGGTPNFRIFNIGSGATVNMSGLTISNGKVTSDAGGGIWNSGALILTSSTVSGNAAESSSGGGIYSPGMLTLTNSTVSGNTAQGGAGIYLAGVTATTYMLNGVTVINNIATSGGSGGGVIRLGGTTTIINSLIANNSANTGRGGGIQTFNNDPLTIVNSTISGNSATTDGGGIDSFSSNLRLTNVTITNNRADSDNNGTGLGGGIKSLALSNALTLNNTIVAGNFGGAGSTSDDIFDNDSIDKANSFNNLIGTGSFLTNGTNGNQLGVTNALLGALANNGGPTMTHALLPGSPALDAGNNSKALDQNNAALTTDQRGFGRIVDGPDADTTDTVDIGAFEAQVSVEDIGDQATNEDTQLQFTFNVGGAANIISVTATSSNTTLVPNNAANIALTGSGSTRTLTINPAPNQFGTSTITITVNGNNSQSMTDTFVLTVNSTADTPIVTNATTNEDTQTTSGLVISRNPSDGSEVTHFKITNITNGTLFKSDGATPIANNTFITVAEGNAGLKFTPAANLFSPVSTFSFQAQASAVSDDEGLGGGLATAIITVSAVADTPSVTNASTTVNTQTTSGLVITRNPADSAEVTHFKITNITNGTLFKNDGTTQINNNQFITVAEGNAGLKFTPALNSNANGSFQVQASLNNTDGGLGGGLATATITVNCGPTVVTNDNDSGAGSLRDIILHACPGSTITFQAGLSNITLTSDELLINKNLTIQGPGANLLTVMRSTAGGTPDFRIFNISAGFTATIFGMTISNGKANGGGGISNSGTLLVNDSTLSGNSATTGLGGGGIFNGNGALTINNSTFSGNSTVANGGGIHNSGNGGTATLTINNSTFSGNTSAAAGGGIRNAGEGGTATLTINNSTLSGNTASGAGGGIRNVTSSGGTATVNLRNTIVAGNLGNSSNPDDIFGTVDASSSFNLIGTGGSGGLTNGVNNNQVGIADVRLGPLASNGGPTQTMALLSGSPALDAGSNTIATNAGLTTDQRGTGFNRIVDGPDEDTTNIVDIGAFEAQVSVENITDKATNEDTQLQFNFNVGGAANITSVTATSSNTTLVPNNFANIAVTGSGSTRTLTINPAANQSGTSTITVTVNGNNSQSITDIFLLTVNAVADTPSVTNASTTVNTQTTSGLVITRNAADGAEVTHFKITNITNGTLFKNDGTTQIFNNQFITFAEGNAGLKFTPANNSTASGSFQVQASLNSNDSGLGGSNATATITVAKAATAVTVASSLNPSGFGQSVTFTATVTSAAGTPTGTVQFKDNGANLGAPVTLNAGGVAQFTTSSLSVGTHAITAEYSGDANFLASTGTLAGGQVVNNPALIKFSQANYDVNESGKFVTITVNRSGDTAPAVSVDYTTPDDSAAMTVLPCSTANGVASSRCDFTTALGTLKFAPGETSKTFDVLISQDSFVEGNETLTLTLFNLTGGAQFVQPSDAGAMVTIIDDDSDSLTPEDTESFVRRQYHDFLNREPDPAGLEYWIDNIDKCKNPSRRPAGMTEVQCFEVFRIHTSAAFFLSIEFQNTGFFVIRVYKTSFGDINPPAVPVPVRFTDFLRDTQEVSAGVIVLIDDWQTQLEKNKQAFALSFVQRPAFLARYPNSTSAIAFVDSLNANAGNVLSDSERAALIAELSPNPNDPLLRAGVLKKIADNETLQQRELNRAFVLMQYFGYLRRNPDAAPEPNLNFEGYNFWLNKLNQFNGNYIDAEMIKAFLSSIEYRQRFGP